MSRTISAFLMTLIVLAAMFFGVLAFLNLAYTMAENGQKRELRIEQNRFGRARTKAEIEIAKQNRIASITESNNQVKIARIERRALTQEQWSKAFAVVGSSFFMWASTPLTQLSFLALLLGRLYLSSPVLPAPRVFRRVAGIRQPQRYTNILEASSQGE